MSKRPSFAISSMMSSLSVDAELSTLGSMGRQQPQMQAH